MIAKSLASLKKSDEWMTPCWYWNLVADFIKDRVIWEPFYGNGVSSKDLSKICTVMNTKTQDFFDVTNPPQVDFVLTNPPYSIKIQIIERLEELDLNYILLLPAQFMFSRFWQKRCRENSVKYSMGVCPKRLGFIKKGKDKSCCPFTCAFFCRGIATPGHYFYL